MCDCCCCCRFAVCCFRRQVNNTIAQLEDLRRRSDQDEEAAEAAAKAAAIARGQARRLRWVSPWYGCVRVGGRGRGSGRSSMPYNTSEAKGNGLESGLTGRHMHLDLAADFLAAAAAAAAAAATVPPHPSPCTIARSSNSIPFLTPSLAVTALAVPGWRHAGGCFKRTMQPRPCGSCRGC